MPTPCRILNKWKTNRCRLGINQKISPTCNNLMIGLNASSSLSTRRADVVTHFPTGVAPSLKQGTSDSGLRNLQCYHKIIAEWPSTNSYKFCRHYANFLVQAASVEPKLAIVFTDFFLPPSSSAHLGDTHTQEAEIFFARISWHKKKKHFFF